MPNYFTCSYHCYLEKSFNIQEIAKFILLSINVLNLKDTKAVNFYFVHAWLHICQIIPLVNCYLEQTAPFQNPNSFIYRTINVLHLVDKQTTILIIFCVIILFIVHIITFIISITLCNRQYQNEQTHHLSTRCPQKKETEANSLVK